MATNYFSVPKSFSSGDAAEWFKRFDICCAANKWSEETKALKLPTLLEGEALAIWLVLDEDVQKEYDQVKAKMVKSLLPTEFLTLQQFHQRKLIPGESLSVFLYDLKKLLQHAMPDVTADVRSQLLLHQLLVGLPTAVSKQLRANGEVNDLEKTIERARLLLSLEEERPTAVATVSTALSEVELKLRKQVDELAEQVAALRGEKSLPRSVTCYHCNQQGHVKRNCPALKNRPLQSRKCFICGRAGHVAKNCLQENFSGVSAQVQVTKQSDSNKIKLVTDSGAALPILQQVEARVSFDGLESPVSHSFLVVKSLISPVIVGVDFLQQQHLSLDFSYCPVRVHHSSQEAASHNSSSEQKKYSSTTAAISSKNAEPEGNEDLQIEQCAIPKFKKTDDVTLPEVEDKTLRQLLEKYKDLFRNSPGVTTLTHHFIPTSRSPIRVPPCRIPAEYRQEVDKLIKDMLAEGIIEESSSPWMAPAVYTKKQSGKIRLCVDYRALN
ncbi:hypothetical protein EMCRGX_G003174 [Ephydatia muelleri]|eukprot:Em0001g2902a